MLGESTEFLRGGDGRSGVVDWNAGMREVTVPGFIPSWFVEVMYG